MKKTYLFLAEGFEDVEALAVVDVLRRGGVEVRTVSLKDERLVKSAHGVKVMADLPWNMLEPGDAECLVFPGGMPGAEHLGNCAPLMALLQQHYDRGGLVGAICAAPAFVLSHLKTEKPMRLTCYPGCEGMLSGHEISGNGVVVDGRIVTGRGPGYALDFGLALLRELRSVGTAKEVAAGMLTL